MKIQETKNDFERVEELTRERIAKRKHKRMGNLFMHMIVCSSLIIILITVAAVVLKSSAAESPDDTEETISETKCVVAPPKYREQLLPVNEYSRPGTTLAEVKWIVIHYTGNTGKNAQQNYSYFEGLAESGQTYASSHFIVGLGGEIIQCVPLDEIAYASNERNVDTISIECCIDNEEGHFNEKTYDSLVHLTAWLMGEYDVPVKDVIRHYDVTGKNCPKYFVEHKSAWEDFKLDLEAYIEQNGTEK